MRSNHEIRMTNDESSSNVRMAKMVRFEHLNILYSNLFLECVIRASSFARVLIALLALALIGCQTHDREVADAHRIYKPDQIEWKDAPNSLPPGAKIAILDGDPSKSGPFCMRLKFPDGYKVMPHWH